MSDILKKARKFILGGLLTVLGFSACDPEDDPFVDMYGSPYVMYGPPPPSEQYQYQETTGQPSEALPAEETVDGRS